RWLADGELRPEPAARLFAFLSEAAQRFGRARGLSVALNASFGGAAAVRFAALDAELYPVRQELLFEATAAELARGRSAYATGFDLAGPESRDGGFAFAATAAVLAAQRCGVVAPPSLYAGARARADETLGALAIVERLDLARARMRSGSPALYALP